MGEKVRGAVVCDETCHTFRHSPLCVVGRYGEGSSHANACTTSKNIAVPDSYMDWFHISKGIIHSVKSTCEGRLEILWLETAIAIIESSHITSRAKRNVTSPRHYYGPWGF